MKRSFLSAFSIFVISQIVAGCFDASLSQNKIDDSDFDPEARLRDLNITLPDPPKPVANYVNGVRTGNLRCCGEIH
jgi:hypothetical protein